MDKKIGILTFHFADNYGAILQAYALRKAINSFPNCNAEIINYVPQNYRSYIIFGQSGNGAERKKREKFREFLLKYCGINTAMIHSVTGNKFDLYIAGSDQIWNTDIPEVFADYEYFFPNLSDEAKRIAYSASIGMDYEKIDRSLFKKYLTKFDKISLREKSYVNIISELSEMECENTLDPTMLLEQKDYERLIRKTDFSDEPFLFHFWYDLGNGGLWSIETVNALARKYRLSVKHIIPPEEAVMNQLIVNKSNYIFQEGIEEFLWCIKNAQVVVTNSFHGAVFSILFKKPLYIYYPEIRKCRQENLVNMFNLQDRVIRGYISPNNLNLKMDYESISVILERERKRSLHFLKNAIEEI